MLQIVSFVGGLTSVSRIRKESAVFKLHYILTVFILLSFCIIVTTKQFVGHPINCQTFADVDDTTLNTFCFIHITYSVASSKNYVLGINMSYPGVETQENLNQIRKHTYYQWVFFVLFIQALFFYAPRWLWMMWEAGKIKALTEDLFVAVMNNDERQAMEGLLINYVLNSWGFHNWYAAKYLFAEALAFTNVFAQFSILNSFFKGSFLRYGSDVVQFNKTLTGGMSDPRIILFPEIAKCQYFKYGTSGSGENYDVVCVLSLNVVNEKIYIFLWFWFIILTILSALSFLMFAMMFAFPIIRYYVLKIQYEETDHDSLRILAQKASFGDFFLIYLIRLNVDIIVFESLISELALKLCSSYRDQMIIYQVLFTNFLNNED